MNYFKAIFITYSLLLLSACGTSNKDIQISAEQDPTIIFTEYKSYDWLGAAGVLNDPDNTWQSVGVDISGDIKYLIDRELRKRKLFKTTGKPDLAVSFFVGINMDNQELKLDEETKIELKKTIPKAGLAVILTEVKSGKVVWVGVATGDVQKERTAELVRQRLDFALTEMFKQLP
ncbi:MAG: DUF4136 domain-containing protein [Methyloprofundus sp.]|nr:DUF4136 domain-containing protein [Methyloprofundus sp.]